MRRIPILLLAFGLLATACGGDDPVDRAQDEDRPRAGDEVVIEVGGEEVVLTSSLSGFDDCVTLLDHLRTEGAERVGPYGFNEGWYGPWPVAFAEDTALDVGNDADFDEVSGPVQGGDAGGPLTEGVDFSGTNVQETGVDEADIVKTDGDRVYIVANAELVVVDVAGRSVVGSVDLPSREQSELFLYGDQILHVTYGWGYGYPVPLIEGDAELAGDIAPFPQEGPETTVTRISVSDGAPRIVESITIEGEYVSSRAVDGVARVVVRSNPQYDFPFVYPAGPSGEDRATESNRDALLDSELSDWLPGFTTHDASGAVTGEGLLPACEQVHAPTEFAGFGVLSVFTVPVDGPIEPTATSSVLAPGAVVYSSPDSVYVATSAWLDPVVWSEADWQQIQDNRQTSIHRFDITSPTSAAYTASGSVPGDVRDSFSMSEHDGHLRVITTTGEPWSDTSETFVRVLRETGGELVEVGSVGDMGRGEAVQSVRFQGDVGYVVTFETIDPFYTLDLRDPANPRVRGELKIPGFSSYLHPLGDGLVLGVGSDADASGRVTGSKVSLFDVGNLDDPQEIATWIGPDGWNNVGWDTHAFLWWAPENVAVVPMQVWENGQQWSGVVVLEVADRTIVERGRIDHADATTGTLGSTECDIVTAEDLPTQDEREFKSELEYLIVEDDNSLVLDCGPDDEPSATGYQCFPEPWMNEEADNIGLVVGGDLVMCWNEGNQLPQIARSMVLPGGELWTVSSQWGWLGGQNDARLQVNDLDSLERLDVIDL